jgi:predicted Fe-Mo cluster-binding NifX family protein
MRIAFPVLRENVSPVLDTAERLLIVQIDKSAGETREEISLSGLSPQKIAEVISSHTNILVCGGLSSLMSTYLDSRGISVYPWVMGNIEHLIDIFSKGDIPGQEYIMPGCRRNRFGGGRCGRRQNNHSNRATMRKKRV